MVKTTDKPTDNRVAWSWQARNDGPLGPDAPPVLNLAHLDFFNGPTEWVKVEDYCLLIAEIDRFKDELATMNNLRTAALRALKGQS